MEKYKFSKERAKPMEDKPAKTSGHGPCEVYDCPMPGHIYTSNWNCRYHHGKSGESLSRITKVLRNNDYVFKWHSKLLQSTIVDWDMGYIAKHAPRGLEALQNESYQAYKARIYKQIEVMLK